MCIAYSLHGYMLCFRWLTDNGRVHLKRVEMILEELGKVEDEIFRTRQERDRKFKANQRRRRQQENKTMKPAFLPQSSSVIAPYAPGEAVPYISGAEARQQAADHRRVGMQTEKAQEILGQLFRRTETTPEDRRNKSDQGIQTEQAKQVLDQLFESPVSVAGKKRSFANGDEDEPKIKVILFLLMFLIALLFRWVISTMSRGVK